MILYKVAFKSTSGGNRLQELNSLVLAEDMQTVILCYPTATSISVVEANVRILHKGEE